MATRIPISIGPAALPSRAKPAPSFLAKIQTNAEGNAETRFAEAANVRKIPRSIILRNLDGRTKIEHSARTERVTICPDDRLVVDVSTVTASLAVDDGPIESRNIDAVAEDIVFIDDDVAGVYPDAKFDPSVLWYISVLLRHAALDFSGTSGHRLRSRTQQAFRRQWSRRCDRDGGVDKGSSDRLELGQRAFFVGTHELAVASDIRRRRRSTRSPVKPCP